MIPRLRPAFGSKEMAAALSFWKEGVEAFESAFARKIGTRHAVSFSYGRSGLIALLHALEIENREVLMPAYTCVVVAHAVVRSGNRPKFVDSADSGFNMDLDKLLSKISPETGAVIATHLYGHPLDLRRLRNLSERGIPVIHDCALAVGSASEGIPIAPEGAAAFYSLNVGKPLSTLYGGVVTTNDSNLYEKLLDVRTRMNRPPARGRSAARWFYLAAQTMAFTPAVYEFTERLARHTPLLDPWLKYYDEDKIDLPSDAQEHLPPLQARIGLAQLDRLEWIQQKRREIVRRYNDSLQGIPNLTLPPFSEEAGYSHYTVRVPDRDRFTEILRRRRIDTGWMFDYAVPDLAVYRNGTPGGYPNAEKIAREAVNLPLYPTLSDKAQQQGIRCVRKAAAS